MQYDVNSICIFEGSYCTVTGHKRHSFRIAANFLPYSKGKKIGWQSRPYLRVRNKIKRKVCNFSFVCFGLMQHFEYLWLLFTIMELISREGLLGFHYDCNGAAISRVYKTLWSEFQDSVHKLWGLILFSISKSWCNWYFVS